MNDIFESSIRSTGDMAGVFESDKEIAYFYLYKIDGLEEKKILDAIRVPIDRKYYSESDVDIYWSSDESIVYLRILGRDCAAFNCSNDARSANEPKIGSYRHTLA